MIKKIVFTLTCLLILNQVNSFSQSISGQVLNNKEQPIIDAHIINLSNGLHTHSDNNGHFTLQSAVVNDTLEISHSDYKTHLVKIDTSTKILRILLKEKSISLVEIVITPKIDALNLIAEIDLQTNPVNSAQEILRQLPGLFIGQHAGGGKAEQIFLRGFDIDHGTDITISVDGLPVNMVSHAHGQGYADLHFVIPETVNKIDFGKGAYFADKGNFNTAGYVNFKTKQILDNSIVKVEAGQFSTYRFLGMFNLVNNLKHKAYVAGEYLATNGPFESPQNFNRLNIFGKYSARIGDYDKIGITLSHFRSQWDASGQIPQRAIDNGLISRFGAIDDTEGGNTSRTNILVNYNKYINPKSSINNSVYFNLYDFELYSNFTFFLTDSINGDQIKQKENRMIYGLNSEYNYAFSKPKVSGDWQLGISLRNDVSTNNELSNTLNRKETLNYIQLGNINETNLGAYLNLNTNFKKWKINPSFRFDYFNFQYNNSLNVAYAPQQIGKVIVSPKLNILYNHSSEWQFYLKTGKGFHSNDSRVVVTESGDKILPASYGFDIGFIGKPVPRLLINTAYWYLFLEQEFVYVGDAGIVEPSGKSQRHGFDLSIRYQTLDWLFLNFDANYAFAKSIEEVSGEDYIPLAPNFTSIASINIIHKSGFYGTLSGRFITNRPANEDNSIVAKGYAIADLNIGYTWKKLNFEIKIENLFNSDWNETQFATESRLKDEAIPVEEIHFTPGTPFFIKGAVEFRF